MTVQTAIYWLSILYVYAFFSNPHLRLSLTRKTYTKYSFIYNSLIKKTYTSPKPVPRFFTIFAWVRETYLIILRFHFVEKIIKNRRKNYRHIYTIITRKRFNINSPYLIAGDHFSSFYPRNLGFFYSKALDPITSTDEIDYKNRVVVYLNSLDFALEYFKKVNLTTTIVPIFGKYFARSDIYAKPADTLCSLLLAFDYLINPKEYQFFPQNENETKIQTEGIFLAKELLDEFRGVLKTKLLNHLNYIHPDYGLVDRRLSLSGIRDGLYRDGSFYENVVTWKTIELALKFKIISEESLENYQKPAILKETILKNYWKNGLLYNDLEEHPEVIDNFSADTLIANSLGFLSANNTSELQILKSLADYVLNNSEILTELGPLYSRKNPKRTVFLVKLAAKDYMGRTVWSHWTTEFCMLLIALFAATGEEKYKSEAIKIAENVLAKIEFYKGYPELYSDKLKIYKTSFYMSMIDTGWIVNFEWVRSKLVELMKQN